MLTSAALSPDRPEGDGDGTHSSAAIRSCRCAVGQSVFGWVGADHRFEALGQLPEGPQRAEGADAEPWVQK